MQRTLLFFLAFLIAFASSAQSKVVSGSVMSADDDTPVPGVNIVIKGTNAGTVTDAAGRYSMEVSSGTETLVFSFIGYQTQEVSIQQRTSLDIRMEADVKELSEVVVTAMGINKQEKALGYSVSEVKSEQLAQVNQTNVVNSLSGRVAGVQVTGASGTMGGSTRITIRGINSVTGNNSPLFVVDGVVMNNSDYNTVSTQRGAGGYDYGNLSQDINPEDIESMSVLKGPNAAALYGSRGANGVILITTKRGSAKKGLGVRINSGVAFEKVFVLPKYQNLYGGGTTLPDNGGGVQGFLPVTINGTQYLTPDYGTDESWGPRYNGQQVLHWNAFDPWDTENYLVPREWKAPDNDVESFFETGVSLSNNVELSGGTDRSTFRVSYTNMTLDGYMPNSKLKRNTISVNGETALSKKVKIFSGANFVKNEAIGRSSVGYDDNNVMQKFNQWGQRQLDFKELAAYKNPDGTQRTWNRIAWDDATPHYSDNPYWTRFENYQNDERNRFFGNVGFSAELLSWLKFETRWNADYYNMREAERSAIGSQGQASYYEGVREFTETNLQFLFLADKKLSETFEINGSFGGNKMDQKFNYNLSQTNGGLIVPKFYNLNNGVNGIVTTDFDNRKRINSLYGNITFAFKDMVFVDVTGRNDWSSSLTAPRGASSNSYFYPAVNTSFVFSQLGIFASSDWLTLGKIRGGWAMVGNDTDAYNNNLVYNTDVDDINFFPYNFGGNPLYSVANTRNNPVLKPETIMSTEFGFALKLFEDRVGIDATYYDKNSKDLILPVQISGSTGVTYTYVNSGTMTNKGFEVQLTGSPILHERGFAWNISANWAKNKNRITSLYDDLLTYTLTNAPFEVTLNAIVGESYGSIRGTDFVYDAAGNIVVDANGRYLASPVKTIGSVLPDWTAGLTNSFSYKGLSLDVLLDVREGGQFFSTTHMWGTYSGILERTAENNIRESGVILDGYTAALDENGSIRYEADGVTAVTTGPNTKSITAQRWAIDHYSRADAQNVLSASYVKLREVRLGFTIPASLTGPFQNVRVAAWGRNLAIWGTGVTDFVDPENTTSSGNIQGLEGGALPSLRTYGFNVSLGF